MKKCLHLNCLYESLCLNCLCESLCLNLNESPYLNLYGSLKRFCFYCR